MKKMSDLNIKKVVISSADLPGFAAVDGGHTVRYRIITEDKNQFSEWSPFYFIPIEIEEVERDYFVNDPINGGSYIREIGANKILDLFWNDLSSFGIREYDIFTKTNSDFWNYQTTTKNNSANIGLGSIEGTTDAKVLIATPQRSYSEELVLFETSEPIDL
jgi:hypothetical protein